MFFFNTNVKKIKIAIGDDVLSNSWFCLVNWHLGKLFVQKIFQDFKFFGVITVNTMALPVVEFSRQGFKIAKVVA